MKTVATRYSPLQIALHWGIFLLFALNYIVSEDMGRALRTRLEGGEPDQFAALIHPPVGLAILALALVRIVVRLRQGAPALPPGKPLLNRAAKLGHAALYLLLLAVPLSGMAAWGAGIRDAGDVHEVLVNLTVLVVVGHAVAALYHQFILKDGLMDRIRPGRR
jgi:cytochrome b561